MSLNINGISVVHWFPHAEKHRCGYCKSDNGTVSYGMWADTMTVRDYQTLIDRGWRRSGRYCYKPIMNEICCPQYTIRCDVTNFKVSKSHKKIIKKFNRFLNDGILHKNTQPPDGETDRDPGFFLKERPNVTFDYKNLDESLGNLDDVSAGSSNHIENPNATINQKFPEKILKKPRVIDYGENTMPTQVKKGVGADPNKLPCKKAKLLRLERKQRKMTERGMNFVKSNLQNETKALEELLEIPKNYKDKLKIRLVTTSTGDDLFADFDVEYEVYKKYQMIIHNDPPEKCSRRAFHRFLVNTPLKAETYSSSDDIGFGSFHQQYWIDDKLIAVGVIDILPKCLSSVYFFYDPDYRSLTLGTYGSLREVEYTRTLHQTVPGIQHYYMGFYIHSCPKMRYKGRLVPSDLLCPETYRWLPIAESIPKLEQNKYSRLNPDPKDEDEDACSPSDIDNIKIFYLDGYVYFKSYKHRNTDRKIYQTIGKFVGKKCVDTLLFVSQRH